MNPFFSFLEYKDSDYQLNNGFIRNIQVTGDNPTFDIKVEGINTGFIIPFTSSIGFPDINNLAPDTYKLTVRDSLNLEEELDIIIAEKPQVILTITVTDNSCLTSSLCDCELTVTGFTHNSNSFRYDLIDSTNTIVDTYTGTTGNEVHIFTGLCLQSYTVIATELDGILYTYNNMYDCSQGQVSISVNDVITNWQRFAVYAPSHINNLPVDADRTIGGSGEPSGAAGTAFDPLSLNYLAPINTTTVEGVAVGLGAASPNKFSLNTSINKYFVGVSTIWATYNPIIDQSNLIPTYGNPTAYNLYTTSDQWGLSTLTNLQHTIDSNDNVVLANSLPGQIDMIECKQNSFIPNGFYSQCDYTDYTHYVTLGSTENGLKDNDDIGIVIAAYKDVLGKYGPKDFTHTLVLRFNNENTPTANIWYNIGSNAQAFTDGNPIISSTLFSGVVARTTNTPFLGLGLYGNNGYVYQGHVRVKIEKIGSIIKIYTTESMGDRTSLQTNAVKILGESNPISTIPLFEIDLADKNTWIGPTDSAPAYADPNALKKFYENPIKIGYFTTSQELTQFYHIVIEGTQSNVIPSVLEENAAQDQETINNVDCWLITDCSNPENTKTISISNLFVNGSLNPNKIYRFSLSEQEMVCWKVEPAEGCPPESIPSTVLEEFDNCEECILEIKQCFDLIPCPDTCNEILNINSFDFTPYLGQQVILNGDSSCIYEPVAIREAFFINVNTNTLSPLTSHLQTGTNLILNVQSLIFNTVEQITGPQPQYILTAANYNPTHCVGYTCTSVAINTTENSFTNIPDFLNTLFQSLNIRLEAHTSSPNFCNIGRNNQFFKIQYRDGDEFSITLQITYGSFSATTTISNTGNVSEQTVTIGKRTDIYELCNTNLYCTADDTADITVDIWNQGCPQPPVEIGVACKITPRLGEPGFSTKNCDPDKVIDIKCKYADSVYALFKRIRYGIETCCEFDLDKIDIKNQLIDLGALYDPDLCISGEPVPYGCCLQPCSATTTVITPIYLTCAAPTNVSVIITT